MGEMLGCDLSQCAVGRAAALQGSLEEGRDELGSFHGGFYSAQWVAGMKGDTEMHCFMKRLLLYHPH